MVEEYIHEIISLARGCHTRKSTLPNDVKDYAATIMDTVVICISIFLLLTIFNAGLYMLG